MAGARILKGLAAASAGGALLALHGWALLALYFWFSRHPGLGWAVAAAYGILLAAIFRLSKTRGHGAAAGLVLAATVVVWWSRREPEAGLAYPPETEQAARLREESNFMTVHGIRDFRYRSAVDFDARWSSRSFNLEELQQVDLCFNYTGLPEAPGVPPVITSFVFKNQPPLAVSIERRVERDEPDTLLRGLFKQYEVFYVWAEERDLIQLLTRCRGGQVVLHRTTLSPDQGRRLLLDMSQRSNALEEAPEFFNALTDGWNDVIARHMAPALGVEWPWYRSPLLSGNYEQLGCDEGWLEHTLPWDQHRAAALINGRAGDAAEPADFSRLIRRHLPVNPQAAYPEE